MQLYENKYLYSASVISDVKVRARKKIVLENVI